jgi:hypothetical protein
MDWLNVVVSILSGLCVCIPLVYKLVMTVTSYIKEKNWNQIIMITTEYMVTAETMFSTGAEKKSWVIEMLKTSSKVSNFDLTEENLLKISELIDNMCALSKKININK